MPERLYLDHNATTPLRPAVREAMIAALGPAQNPSSVHAEGRAAKARLEEARRQIAEAIGAQKEGLIFTGGATEAIAMALYGLVRGPAGVRQLLVSAIEHDAVKATARTLAEHDGVTVAELPVDANGVLDLDSTKEAIAAVPKGETFAVCVMLANNETGVIQPTGKLGPMVWPRGGYVLVDAVQGLGKLPLNFDRTGADLMVLGAHKAGGPVGVGALALKPGIGLEPLLRGGGQESNRRAGTHNLPGILGFAAAVAEADPARFAALQTLRDRIEAGLPDGVTVWGKGAQRLANTLCFSAPGFPSETQLMVLDLAGIAVSKGSACSSGKTRASAVLAAMGADEEQAKCAIRVSMGWNTPDDAPERFLAAWTAEYERIAKGRAA